MKSQEEQSELMFMVKTMLDYQYEWEKNKFSLVLQEI